MSAACDTMPDEVLVRGLPLCTSVCVQGGWCQNSHNQMPVTQYLTKNEIGRFRLIVTFLLRTVFIEVMQPAAEQNLTAPIFISEALKWGTDMQCEPESPQTLMTLFTSRSNCL